MNNDQTKLLLKAEKLLITGPCQPNIGSDVEYWFSEEADKWFKKRDVLLKRIKEYKERAE